MASLSTRGPSSTVVGRWCGVRCQHRYPLRLLTRIGVLLCGLQCVFSLPSCTLCTDGNTTLHLCHSSPEGSWRGSVFRVRCEAASSELHSSVVHALNVTSFDPVSCPTEVKRIPRPDKALVFASLRAFSPNTRFVFQAPDQFQLSSHAQKPQRIAGAHSPWQFLQPRYFTKLTVQVLCTTKTCDPQFSSLAVRHSLQHRIPSSIEDCAR